MRRGSPLADGQEHRAWPCANNVQSDAAPLSRRAPRGSILPPEGRQQVAGKPFSCTLQRPARPSPSPGGREGRAGYHGWFFERD